jgi:hypothetical protein
VLGRRCSPRTLETLVPRTCHRPESARRCSSAPRFPRHPGGRWAASSPTAACPLSGPEGVRPATSPGEGTHP